MYLDMTARIIRQTH